MAEGQTQWGWRNPTTFECRWYRTVEEATRYAPVGAQIVTQQVVGFTVLAWEAQRG